MAAMLSALRLLAIWTWLGLCLAVLGFAFVQRQIHDMDIAYTYLMLFLTFPAGLLVALVLAAVGASVSLPTGFIFALISWPLFVILGYLQWFVLLPKTVRRFRQPSNSTPHTDARASAVPNQSSPAARAGERGR